MYLLIPLIEVIFCLALLVVLLIRGKRQKARLPFAIFLVFMTVWGFFTFMMRASTDISDTLLWEKLALGSMLSASLFFYCFAVALTGIRPEKHFIYPLYISYFVVLALIPTGLMVSGMRMMWYDKAPAIGPLFIFYLLCAYLPIGRSAVILIRRYRRTQVVDDDRVRYQYLIGGLAAFFIGAATDYLLAMGVKIYPLGLIGNILFCVAATTAMLKHNLLEIEVVIRKGTTYSLTGLLPWDLAVSIDSANRYETIKQKHSELTETLDGIIHAMTRVVETRDPYTAGHQRRVAELARAIALEMGLPEWQAKGIYITGLLHDVGKVAVPTEILSKPGKINQDEFSIIKNHSRIGHDILRRIEFPWPVTQAILQHHERLDGSGYPSGLAGEEIIIEARILGVADVVEAMSSHRPYRPALGLDAALDEINKGRGILYDCAVADTCLNLLKKNETEFTRIIEAAASHT
jgi:putative nucleotidyltransferase with HDIG domain